VYSLICTYARLQPISSAKRRVSFNGSWKTRPWLGLKLEYSCMHSCCSYTMVGSRATLAKWSWLQCPFLSQHTSRSNTCSGSGAFADCQNGFVRKAAGADLRLIGSLQFKSPPLAFYLVVREDQKKAGILFFSNCKCFDKFCTFSNFLCISNIVLSKIWIHKG